MAPTGLPERRQPAENIALKDFVYILLLMCLLRIVTVCCAGLSSCARGADFRVGSDAAYGRAPRCQVIGQFNFYRYAPVSSRHDIRLPERSVFEVLADRWLRELAIVLEVGELVRRLRAREVNRLLAREAAERIRHGKMRLD